MHLSGDICRDLFNYQSGIKLFSSHGDVLYVKCFVERPLSHNAQASFACLSYYFGSQF